MSWSQRKKERKQEAARTDVMYWAGLREVKSLSVKDLDTSRSLMLDVAWLQGRETERVRV